MHRILSDKEDAFIQHTARLLMNVIASKAKKAQQREMDVKMVVYGGAVRFVASLLHAAPKAGIQTVSGNLVQDFCKDVEKQMGRLG